MSVDNQPQESEQSRTRRRSSARERHLKRKERRQKMAQLRTDGLARLPEIPLDRGVLQRVLNVLQNLLWQLRHKTPIPKILAGAALLFVLMLIGSQLFSDKISPGVYALDIPLSGLTITEAEAILNNHLTKTVKIELFANDERVLTLSPPELGLKVDVPAMVENAKNAGLSGIPFAVGIDPILEVDYGLAQENLLNLSDEFYIPAYEAGYKWRDGDVLGVPGTASRELDIALSLERLMQNPEALLQYRRFDVSTLSTPPVVADPTPYLDEARQFLEKDFQFIGYDPLRNVHMPWKTIPEEMARWLQADVNGLSLRYKTFENFVEALNEQQLKNGEYPRYLDVREVVSSVKQAIKDNADRAYLRVRYLPGDYTIVRGDNGFRIGRKTGIPFGLIQDMNPGVNWNLLSPGQEVRIPSYDVLLPEIPVPNKRIVVDLDALWLVAYENDEMLFEWPISAGQEEAPTSPGIYQILLHEEVAYGSSFSLCGTGSTQCAQWEMDWFMGVYEVRPGLMNGFHGNVLLPNGALLGGGGGNQSYSTFGCVMSDNTEAKQLYDWAENGTMVEFISTDFAPVSVLGQQAQEYIRSRAALRDASDIDL